VSDDAALIAEALPASPSPIDWNREREEFMVEDARQAAEQRAATLSPSKAALIAEARAATKITTHDGIDIPALDNMTNPSLIWLIDRLADVLEALSRRDAEILDALPEERDAEIDLAEQLATVTRERDAALAKLAEAEREREALKADARALALHVAAEETTKPPQFRSPSVREIVRRMISATDRVPPASAEGEE